MQVNELLSQDAVHRGDVRRMAPERIVDSSEGNASLDAFKRGVHHMSGIEGVNEVRREGSVLLHFIDWLIIKALNYGKGLDHSLDDIPLRLRFIGLDTRQSERGDPFDGLTSAGHDLGAFREPFLNAVGIFEQITDALDCDFSEILRGLVQLTVGLIESLILELPLNLRSSTNECYTIH